MGAGERKKGGYRGKAAGGDGESGLGVGAGERKKGGYRGKAAGGDGESGLMVPSGAVSKPGTELRRGIGNRSRTLDEFADLFPFARALNALPHPLLRFRSRLRDSGPQ
ncbi:hypothetical protein DW839_14105 [Enterocloster bolteae]|uniref:Uncharacterized protein n=1 Tax=Enterocloster bolteae TaxID=208479 RepID=A0A414AUT3_9FIRM|nr:hypothetical protein DW839_14105 [Enterocloster bolteae]